MYHLRIAHGNTKTCKSTVVMEKDYQYEAGVLWRLLETLDRGDALPLLRRARNAPNKEVALVLYSASVPGAWSGHYVTWDGVA
jgi:hypothetical protein